MLWRININNEDNGLEDTNKDHGIDSQILSKYDIKIKKGVYKSVESNINGLSEMAYLEHIL